MAMITVNRTAQWFAGKYPGPISPDVAVWVAHSTETPGLDVHGDPAWPGYDGGAKAPNETIVADIPHEALLIRQHFKDGQASRALRNPAGGVQTNQRAGGVWQSELAGTCSAEVSAQWQRRGLRPGVHYIEWWRPPGWVLDALAAHWLDLNDRMGVPVKLGSRLWLPYPQSAGASAARLGSGEWGRASGLLGHQHVPENVHGDPGAFPAADLLRRALALRSAPSKPAPEDDMPLTDTDVDRVAHRVVELLRDTPISRSTAATKAGAKPWPLWKALSVAAEQANAAAVGTAALGGALQKVAAAGGADTARLVAAAREGARLGGEDALSGITLTVMPTDGPVAQSNE